MTARDAAGLFPRGNNNKNKNNRDKSKKGTVNVAASAGKDNDGDESGDEATKADDSSTSKLTEDTNIGELLRLTRHIHTTIGMREEDGKIYEEDGSWDGDVLVNIGVGFCQVQGEKPRRATVVNEEWLVQPVEQVRYDSCRCDVCVGGAIFVTYSRKIKFLAVEYLPRRTAKQLANALRKVIFVYARGGFVVQHAMLDMDFEK